VISFLKIKKTSTQLFGS